MPYELREEDLKNKSPELLEISPYGKVPVVVHDDKVIFESAICNEYLEEVFPQQALMPQDAFERAQVRIWTDYVASYFSRPAYRIRTSTDAQEVAESWRELRERCAYMEAHLAEADKGWFVGGRLTLADINFLPFVHRLTQLEPNILPDYPALERWYGQCRERPSFAATVTA